MANHGSVGKLRPVWDTAQRYVVRVKRGMSVIVVHSTQYD